MKPHKILSEANAVIQKTHVVYTSGKHGSAYVNKDALYPNVFRTSLICLELAKQLEGLEIDAIVAPATGGIALSQWTAYHLTLLDGKLDNPVLSVYADKVDDTFVIKRGYDKLIHKKKVAVVEDILNTGGSARKTVNAVRECGGNIVVVGALCNRGGVIPEMLGAPDLISLIEMKLDAWDEDKCPLCLAGVKINTDIGKGREYLARKVL